MSLFLLISNCRILIGNTINISNLIRNLIGKESANLSISKLRMNQIIGILLNFETYLRFGATLRLFETLGQLDDLHAQVSALAFDLKVKQKISIGEKIYPYIYELILIIISNSVFLELRVNEIKFRSWTYDVYRFRKRMNRLFINWINFFNIVKFNLNKNEYLKYLKSNEIYNSYVYMNRICLSLIYILHYRY